VRCAFASGDPAALLGRRTRRPVGANPPGTARIPRSHLSLFDPGPVRFPVIPRSEGNCSPELRRADTILMDRGACGGGATHVLRRFFSCRLATGPMGCFRDHNLYPIRWRDFLARDPELLQRLATSSLAIRPSNFFIAPFVALPRSRCGSNLQRAGNLTGTSRSASFIVVGARASRFRYERVPQRFAPPWAGRFFVAPLLKLSSKADRQKPGLACGNLCSRSADLHCRRPGGRRGRAPDLLTQICSSELSRPAGQIRRHESNGIRQWLISSGAVVLQFRQTLL